MLLLTLRGMASTTDSFSVNGLNVTEFKSTVTFVPKKTVTLPKQAEQLSLSKEQKLVLAKDSEVTIGSEFKLFLIPLRERTSVLTMGGQVYTKDQYLPIFLFLIAATLLIVIGWNKTISPTVG